MKRIVAGILLGLSLELGCSGAAYAEAPEIAAEFSDTAESDGFYTEGTGKSEDVQIPDAADGQDQAQAADDTDDPEMLPENGGDAAASFASDSEGQQSEAAFFSGSSDEMAFTDGISDEAQEEVQTAELSEEEAEILSKIPADATEVTLDVQDGMDITSVLNLVLNFMGQRATDASPCKVIVPPGNYYISNTIHLYSNMTLYAQGAVITKSSTNKHIILRLGDEELSEGGYNGYRNVTIDGGTWDLNYQNVEGKENPGGFVGFRIGHATNVTVKNVTFLNNLKSHFLELAGVKDAVVTGCTFRGYWKDYEGGGQECIQLDACLDYIFPRYQPFDGAVCENVLIENNTFEDVFAGVGSHSMVYDRPYRNIQIRNNTFRNIRKRAVWCLNYVDSVVENNTLENVGGGVLVCSMYSPNTHLAPDSAAGVSGNHYTAGITVRKNSISISDVSTINGKAWYGYGVQVQGTSVKSGESAVSRGIPADIYKETGVNVEENSISGSGYGIKFYLVDNCRIKNNEVALKPAAHFSNPGIYLNASSGNVVSDNLIYGSKLAGVYTYNGGKGLKISAQNNTITANMITEISGDGVYLNASSGNTVSNNQISDCKGVGVHTYNGGKSLKVPCVGNKINENTILTTGADGIYITADSTGTIINKNIVKSGKKNGIAVKDSKKCQITANQVYGVKLDGIYLRNLGDTVIKSNKVSSVPGWGIQVLFSQVKSLNGNAVTGSKKCGLKIIQSKVSGYKNNKMEKNGTSNAIYVKGSTGAVNMKLPVSAKITKNTSKITGTAAGAKKLTVYAVTKSGNKKIGQGNINSKKKYSISIKKQKKGTVLRFALADKYGNISYTEQKVK